jgi:hypothetical protein
MQHNGVEIYRGSVDDENEIGNAHGGSNEFLEGLHAV